MGRYTAPHGWDGANWRKLPLLWGYSDIYGYQQTSVDVDEGFNSLVFPAVPAGEIWVINHFSADAVQGNPTSIELFATIEGSAIMLARELYLFANDLVKWTGSLVLKEGQYLTAWYWGCAAGDDLFAYAAGYKMKVAE